jgi:hypothetical protein
MNKVASIVLVFFTMFVFQPVVSATASMDNILGQVAVIGEGGIFLNSGKWMKIERIYPIIDGSKFKTNQGKMSFIFKDGTRLEVGDSSEVVIRGKVGNYLVEVLAGKVIFSVPEGTEMVIKTPDLIGEIKNTKKVIQKITDKKNTTIVGILYDGKKTKVVTFSGQMYIKTSNGETMMKLTTGKGVEVSSVDKNVKIIQVQAIGAETLASEEEKVANMFFFILTGTAAAGVYLIETASKSPSSP